jgi:hypothetical protein
MTRIISISLFIFLISIANLSAQDHQDDIEQLFAQGDGMIAFSGQGQVRIEGEGLLFIVDRSDLADITLDSDKRYYHSERESRGNTVHTYRKFEGTATITGDDIAVLFDGINMTTSISGTGIVLIEGSGKYTLDDIIYEWSADSVVIELGTLPVNR